MTPPASVATIVKSVVALLQSPPPTEAQFPTRKRPGNRRLEVLHRDAR
jgi:hypothetical protein